jgi:hypothetical protein
MNTGIIGKRVEFKHEGQILQGVVIDKISGDGVDFYMVELDNGDIITRVEFYNLIKTV